MKPNACLPEFLVSTAFVDSDSSEVRKFAARILDSAQDLSAAGKAIRLFEAVRDRIRYDPFDVGTTEDDYRASGIAGKPSNYCVPKAILLTAALRAVGIPAAVGFADVRNHLNSPKLAELMGLTYSFITATSRFGSMTGCSRSRPRSTRSFANDLASGS